MLRRKIFVLWLLEKTMVLNFIGKSFNLAPLLYRCPDASVRGLFSHIPLSYKRKRALKNLWIQEQNMFKGPESCHCLIVEWITMFINSLTYFFIHYIILMHRLVQSSQLFRITFHVLPILFNHVSCERNSASI